MNAILTRARHDTRGAVAIEYVIIAFLVAIIAWIGYTYTGINTAKSYNSTAQAIDNAGTTCFQWNGQCLPIKGGNIGTPYGPVPYTGNPCPWYELLSGIPAC